MQTLYLTNKSSISKVLMSKVVCTVLVWLISGTEKTSGSCESKTRIRIKYLSASTHDAISDRIAYISYLTM